MPLSDAARIPPAVGQLINFRLDEISFTNNKGEEQTSRKLVLEYTRLDGSMFDGLSFWLPKGWPNTHGPSSAIGRWLAHAASVQPEKDFTASTTKEIVEEMFGQFHCLECRDDLVQTGRGDNRRMLHTPTALFASREEAEEWWNQYGVVELDTGNLASEAEDGGDVAGVYVEAARGMLERGLDQETIVARLKLAGCTKASMAILKASF